MIQLTLFENCWVHSYSSSFSCTILRSFRNYSLTKKNNAFRKSFNCLVIHLNISSLFGNILNYNNKRKSSQEHNVSPKEFKILFKSFQRISKFQKCLTAHYMTRNYNHTFQWSLFKMTVIFLFLEIYDQSFVWTMFMLFFCKLLWLSI